MSLLSLLFGCGGSDSPYRQENGQWYYKKVPIPTEKGETLVPIGKKFAKSHRAAYFEGSLIGSREVDLPTFEALSDQYAKDKRSVWFCDTYRKGQEYFAVKHYRALRIDGADAASFRMLNAYYARDTSRVYHDGVGFGVRDIATYERIGDMHARDRVSGYYLRAEIPGSDGSSFTFVDGHYSKDRAHVFWSDYDSGNGAHPPVEVSVALPDADPTTFVMLEAQYAADARQVYYQGRVISGDRTSFRVLERDYALSDSQVFYRGEVLRGADAATFVVLPATGDGPTAQDKDGKFNHDKRVPQ